MVPTIYILDDDLTYAKVLAVNVGQAGRFRPEVFEHAADLLDRCAEKPPDAVLTDLVMPGMNGIDVTRKLRENDPYLPVFVLTAHAEMATAIEALKAGANEYLTKPVNIDELTTQLKRALEDRPLREEAADIQQVRVEEFSVQAILGEDPKVEEVRGFIREVAQIPRPTVLLMGESGTGKNLVARAIHYSSPHSAGRFVEINCSALPPQLLEAELFGYKKGAFTDARESKRGLIEVADGGTLFLDEISEMPLELQAKLLNFLESRRFRRIGGTEEIEVSQRLITATNRDLEAVVKMGMFRKDLFYRISVAGHILPPLREIRGDIPLLANHFRELFTREFRKEVESIAEDAIEVLKNWDWPGNVRELRNVTERALIFAKGPQIARSDLPDLGTLEAPGAPPRRMGDEEYIRLTLEQCDGSVQMAADALGISRKNLWEKRKKYGLLG
jgi:DNA-binding NtrC family response regulator